MFCNKCGAPVNENQAFCTSCGAPVQQNSASNNPQNEFHAPNNNYQPPFNPNTAGMQPRSIVTAIILSIVTCGIYSIYWFICLTDDMNKAAGTPNDTSGVTAFLLTVVTCGIYGLFWAYKIGEKRDIITRENGSSNILYLILSIFGFSIIVYCLAQDAINKAIERR